jgi:hypothetical protein
MPRSPRLPRVKDSVLVLGYPVGGESLSITKGIVSRIEFERYYFETRGLRVQVDAAINPGNSGGPAMVDDAMIGIVFSRLQQAENVGYIIPNEEIDLFLADIADGHYDGKPASNDVFRSIQNESLKDQLKLGKGVTGLLVWNPFRGDPGYPLKRWDVVTRIGSHAIDNAGMVEVNDGLRLWFLYYIQSLARNGTVRLELVREGKPVKVDLPVPCVATRPMRIPFLFDRAPSYLVWGPLVFETATCELFDFFNQKGAAEYWYSYMVAGHSVLLDGYGDPPSFEGEQLVVAVSMFPHRLVQGYSEPSLWIVDQVDGVVVKNLRHLAELLRDARGDRVTITFRDKHAGVYVLDRKQVLAAQEQILSDNSVRKPYSDDLKPVLDPKR